MNSEYYLSSHVLLILIIQMHRNGWNCFSPKSEIFGGYIDRNGPI